MLNVPHRLLNKRPLNRSPLNQSPLNCCLFFRSLPGVLSALIAVLSLLLSGCATPPDSASFKPSGEQLPDYDQPTFAGYQTVTRQWVKTHRAFITANHERETDLNSPFEMQPAADSVQGKRRGILLVHGLGDSPGYMRDIAKIMAADGWLVRSILLPGHGTRPADTLLAHYDDWTGVVAHQAELLSEDVDEVWLGGFSTGGNLVTSYAIEHKEVAGLLLFSPGFYPISQSLLALSPVVSYLWNWVDVDAEDNILRYESLTTNASALYYQSVKDVQALLEEKGFDRPALITISQDDSVLQPDKTLQAFSQHFTNPSSRLVWYGDEDISATADQRVSRLPSYLPQQRISNFSHMSVVFSPANPYVGEDGSYIMLNNGQQDAVPPQQRKDFWFSAWGFREDGKYHARLTWNPYFTELEHSISEVTESHSGSHLVAQ
ncbi:MAG: alpha/beta hydrolase [Oceanospirillaceae bacterium]|uniref:alpha/beta hydrolase n=1 Tax=unclassified Thalassolituus TaxID=2624967 RepID=UPI000C617310|nr:MULTISPECIES: alpha/beta fold hydrolase [unclassified Thalassolituus]MAS25378.1 alpha/beta hydrolase [Oceanospirillaceae bacterium]MAY00478.1 alpha/beta hydrolase [Oceanospirillaceae bacterium]MBL34500.1 alpha/beta hydrolase [Oceanospirillaceae bacterium]MBS52638.1 alpha/beta hydrolase [Oceanospirillaceae bacterium]